MNKCYVLLESPVPCICNKVEGRTKSTENGKWYRRCTITNCIHSSDLSAGTTLVIVSISQNGRPFSVKLYSFIEIKNLFKNYL